MVGKAPLEATSRTLRRLVPKQSLKGLVKALIASPLDAAIATLALLCDGGAGAGATAGATAGFHVHALAVCRALAAAVIGSVAAALALEAARAPSSPRRPRRSGAPASPASPASPVSPRIGAASNAARKAVLKTLVAASAKAALKSHALMGPVAAAAASTGVGIMWRNWCVDALRARSAARERRDAC